MSDSEAQDWLANADSVESIQAVVCDLNGILRGKRVPIGQAKKVLEGGIRMPLSIVGVDVWGEDIVGSSQVFASGDMDGICSPTGRGALPVNWTLKPSAVVPLWLFKETGEPFLADPRQAQELVLAQELGGTLTLALRSPQDAGTVIDLGLLDQLGLLKVPTPVIPRPEPFAPLFREFRGGS